MNYLAHAFLSFRQPQILVGNMISDFVKGKKKEDYPDLIKKGIMLHRAIDNFTDLHETNKLAKQFFRPHYRLYSGAFVDVVYDHFLANDSNEFNHSRLMEFSQQTYAVLDQYNAYLPEGFSNMLPYMKKQNWLYNYHYRRGIQNSFGGLVHRATYLTESKKAFEVFENHYNELRECYDAFFPDVKKMAWQHFQSVLSA
jgi:acyl carrier protein phosphodiesterase